MRINCAKSSKPLGVRGKGEAAFVFCPDPIKRIRNGRRKKWSGTKVFLSECMSCNHFRGVHETMNVDVNYPQLSQGASYFNDRTCGHIDKCS